MLPYGQQLNTAPLAVGSLTLVSALLLALLWSIERKTHRAAVPIAALNFDISIANLEVHRIDFERYLSFVFQALLIQPLGNAILYLAWLTKVSAPPICKMCQHFRRAFVERIPGVIAIIVTKLAIIQFGPARKLFHGLATIPTRKCCGCMELSTVLMRGAALARTVGTKPAREREKRSATVQALAGDAFALLRIAPRSANPCTSRRACLCAAVCATFDGEWSAADCANEGIGLHVLRAYSDSATGHRAKPLPTYQTGRYFDRLAALLAWLNYHVCLTLLPWINYTRKHVLTLSLGINIRSFAEPSACAGCEDRAAGSPYGEVSE